MPDVAHIAGRGPVRFFIYVPWAGSARTWTRASDDLALQTYRTACRPRPWMLHSKLQSYDEIPMGDFRLLAVSKSHNLPPTIYTPQLFEMYNSIIGFYSKLASSRC